MTNKPIQNPQLGKLELEILNVLWSASDSLSVADVVKALDHSRAYTTVMTTMSRLYDKGFLTQTRDGRAYSYQPRISKSGALKQMWEQISDILGGGDLVELVPHLLGREAQLTDQERETLTRLAQDIPDDTE